MGGGHDEWDERRFHDLAAMLRDAEVTSQQSLRSGSPEANDHFRLQRSDFRVEPRTARGDLGPVRLFVNAPLAPCLPFEMLDRVSDVGFFAVDAGFLERAVQ